LNPQHATHHCKRSLLVLWLVRSLYISPLLFATLVYRSYEARELIHSVAQRSKQQAQELRFLQQSLLAATPPPQNGGSNFSADKRQVIAALSLPIAEGLSSIEFPPVPDTKLKSVTVEGDAITVEYELPNLQITVTVSETLNDNQPEEPWRLLAISASEGPATRYTAKWQRHLKRTQAVVR
jgi:hypothetical protein